jgi:hypothetical protein
MEIDLELTAQAEADPIAQRYLAWLHENGC